MSFENESNRCESSQDLLSPYYVVLIRTDGRSVGRHDLSDPPSLINRVVCVLCRTYVVLLSIECTHTQPPDTPSLSSFKACGAEGE